MCLEREREKERERERSTADCPPEQKPSLESPASRRGRGKRGRRRSAAIPPN